MRREPLIYLAFIALSTLINQSDASFHLERHFLARRQSGESEQESTTPKSQPSSSGQQQPPSTVVSNDPPPPDGRGGRLYPDLTRGPAFLPPFNAPPQQHGQMPPPFVPFNVAGVQRLNADQQPGPFGPRMLRPPPRPMSAAERLQSQSFADGLGRRLLSMIGMDMGDQQNGTVSTPEQPASMAANPMGALQNATVLSELNKRLGLVMGSLSKMYNSTVREQLNLLNERFKKETENSTNPWQQHVAQRVPEFFQQMTMKVSNAQEQLNRVWRDLIQVAQGNESVFARQPSARSSPFSIDQFMHSQEPGGGPASFFNQPNNNGDFLGQIGRSLGLQPSANGTQQPVDLGARLREFWHVQVQPQIGMVRNQMARVWRDLTTSGALTPDVIMRSRAHQPNQGSNNSNNDLVDSLLKEADTESAEFALITPKEGDGGQKPLGMPKLNPQIQARLTNMQRDLNQLWQGLSSSLQNAVNNARATLNPRGPFNQMSPQNPDQAQNEIDGKVQSLSKLQKEADVILDTVQQQQQRQTLADRFRGFINNVDLRDLNQLPDQIGAQMNRFGTVIGNFWNTIPERLENMMAQSQNQANQARLRAQVNARTTTPASNNMSPS